MRGLSVRQFMDPVFFRSFYVPDAKQNEQTRPVRCQLNGFVNYSVKAKNNLLTRVRPVCVGNIKLTLLVVMTEQ